MGLLNNIATAVFGKNRNATDIRRTIPPPAPMFRENVGAYGGPGFVDDYRQAPVTPRSNHPWAPAIGQELDTKLVQEERQRAAGGESDDYYRLHGRARAETLSRTQTQETIQTTGFVNSPDGNDERQLYKRRDGVARSIPDTRWTMGAHQELYSFQRPFGQHAAFYLNGDHFSMADHRRTYPIGGMQPVTQRRNTFRLDVPQWDVNIVDMPTEPEMVTGGYAVTSAQNAPQGVKSYRL